MSGAYGGPALSVPRLAEALQGAGAEVGLWSADGSAPNESSPVKFLHGSLNEALENFGDPDIVHDNGIWLLHNHRLAAIAKRKGWRRIVSPRGMLDPWAINHKRAKKFIAWTLYQRRDLDRAARLQATSSLESAGIARLGLRTTVDIIPNGIDPVSRADVEKAWEARTAAIRPKSRRALFIGRLHPVKNLVMLLDAWARAAPRDWALFLVGPDEGGHRAALADRVARLGLEQSVTLLGPVGPAEKRSLLFSSDLFVLPSFQESFGMAVGEALAHGIPAITTTGAPWETLPARGAGWRIEPTIDALVQTLLEATNISDAERQNMGLAAYDSIDESYDWARIAERTLMSYRASTL